tara:strand:+ start:127997 stop:128944 length:948 start_codon:yes stop_codon:yes gene_type:complete
LSIENLRPESLKEYIGQEEHKENLEIYIEAAKIKQKPINHILIHGAAGLGKTSLASVIAAEFGKDVKFAHAPNIEKMADLMPYLINLEDGDFLFIDEIHALDKRIEENLYTIMEDFRTDIIIQKGTDKEAISLDLNKFTLIGATTMKGKLSAPLSERFGIDINLKPYTIEELIQIIKINFRKLDININDDSAYEIAIRSRGTPRKVIHIINRVYDFALVNKKEILEKDFIIEVLEKLKIDKNGLNEVDHIILKLLKDKGEKKPIGINALCSSLNENRETIENKIEPYLLQAGFIERTPRGRIITKKGLEAINNIN